MDEPIEDSLSTIKQKSDVLYSQNCENPEQSYKKSRSNSRIIGEYSSNQNSHITDVSAKSANFIRELTHEDVAQQISKWPFIKQFYQRNTAQFQVKLIETFMKVPSEKDTSGFIYGFMDEKQNSVIQIPYWIKIGRTNNQCPQNRIFQWEKDDNKLFTEIFTVRSLYNHKLESLVHSLFAYARKDRHINGKRRIQWFRFGEPTMTAAAVNILNHIMNTIHEKYWNLNHRSSYLSSDISEYKELGSSQRENKVLRNMDSKLLETIKYLDQLGKLEDPKKFDYFLNPIRTDLSIQIRDKEKKEKLKEINSLEEGLRIMEGSSLGNQISGVAYKIKTIRQSMEKIQTVFEKLEKGLVIQLRDLSKNTEVKFKPPTNEIKQTENTNEQLVEISKQQYYYPEVVAKPQQNLPLDQKLKHFRKKIGKNGKHLSDDDQDESKIDKYMKKKNITPHKQEKVEDKGEKKLQPQQQETLPPNYQIMEIEQIEENHEVNKQQQESKEQQSESKQEPSQVQQQEEKQEEDVLSKYKKDKTKEILDDQKESENCSFM